MKLYTQGVNFYGTHEEGLTHYYRCQSKVCINLMKDGSSSITFLDTKPLYPYQVEFNPIGNNVKFNFENECL